MITSDGNSIEEPTHQTSAREAYERPALTEHAEWDILTGSMGSGSLG